MADSVQREQKGRIAATVRKYFTDSPGVEIHIDSVVKDTGLTRKQVLNAISSRRYSGDNIQPVIAGQVYRLLPQKQETDKPAQFNGRLMLMRVLTELTDGDLLWQDDEMGTVYRGRQLK